MSEETLDDSELREAAMLVLNGQWCRGFTILSESWYGESNIHHPTIDELMIGIYANGFDEGTMGEFGIRWQHLGGSIASRLEIFDDTWKVMPLFQDLIDILPQFCTSSNTSAVTIKTVAAKLVSMGYVDLTRREQKSLPHAPDYHRMKLRANQPIRIEPPFTGILKDRPPFVVCFMGGATFDEGVVTQEVRDFVEANCQHGYVIDPNDVFFEDEGDAMLVSMRFGR